MTNEALPELVPVELPKPSKLALARRAVHGCALAVRYILPAFPQRLFGVRQALPKGARRLFERMGATYIKLGQFAASTPSLVGEKVAAEFRDCLDTGPAVPFDRVRAIVESELGRPLRDAFATFEEKPLASASIAVVHRATLHDGTPVAVKVLRPDIERTVATDLTMMERFVRFNAGLGINQMYNLVGLIVGLRMQIAEELDLRNESRTMDLFRALYERYGLSSLVIPHVHHELTAQRVLTMEFLDGKPLDDLANASALGVDPAPLVRDLLKAWVLTGLRVGAFHADIHAGNLLLMNDGRLGMLDWGIVARMDIDSQRAFRGLCEASIGIEEAWEEIGALMIEMNGPSFHALGLTDEDVHRFARATFEPALTYPLKDVSMGELMMSSEDVIQRATGEAAPKRTFVGYLRGMRDAARAYRTAAGNNAFESPTMRMGFLSMKQLVYLERYGRMYIPDEALLGDKDFVRKALDGVADNMAAAPG